MFFREKIGMPHDIFKIQSLKDFFFILMHKYRNQSDFIVCWLQDFFEGLLLTGIIYQKDPDEIIALILKI